MTDTQAEPIEQTITTMRKEGDSRLIYDKETQTIVQQRTAMTADQQIRAKALECAVLSLPLDRKVPNEKSFDEAVDKFETYIREGK